MFKTKIACSLPAREPSPGKDEDGFDSDHRNQKASARLSQRTAVGRSSLSPLAWLKILTRPTNHFTL